jgi:hypothetical protein
VAFVAMVEFFERIHAAVAQVHHELFV